MADLIKRATLQVNVQQSLSCSNCQKIPMKEEVIQCSNGHIICEVCYPKKKACPSCQIDFRKKNAAPIKCVGFVMEVMNVIPLSCSFKDAGCKEPDMTRALMTEHLEHCEFRTLKKDRKAETDEPTASSSSASQAPVGSTAVNGQLKCDICAKMLRNLPIFMNHHNLVHGRKKSWIFCPFCGNHYCNTSGIFRHLSRCHHQGQNENAGRPGFFCVFCQDRFDEKKELAKHMIQNHKDGVFG